MYVCVRGQRCGNEMGDHIMYSCDMIAYPIVHMPPIR